MHLSTLEHHLSSIKSAYTHISHATLRAIHPFGPRTIRPPLQAQVHSQHLSSLPLEIRHQIYAHVLHSYGTVQHLSSDSSGRNSKIKHVRCPTSFENTRTLHQLRGKECFCDHQREIADNRSVQDGWQVVPLLLSCRQV
jgi:hypothetical protein